MKPITKIAALTLAILPVIFSSCVKDSCKKMHTYSYFVPVYKTKDEVKANIRSNSPKEVAYPGKIYIRGNYIFLNEINKGIHVIDNSNPSQPVNIAFIDIPGTLDLAVKGNTLYADMYTDLVAIDITNPGTVVLKKLVENIFPHRYYGGGFLGSNAQDIIIDWVRKDTTVMESCDNPRGIFNMDGRVFLSTANNTSPASSLGSGTLNSGGQGGSMARFTLIRDRLYILSGADIDVFNVSNEHSPTLSGTTTVTWDIETIYPFLDKLFIGARNGMYIYDVSNPDVPVQAGKFAHVRVCDPVIADNTYAYVTLRSGSECQGFTNQLDILQLNNLSNPSLLKSYKLKNPHGLSKDDNTLFICDGADGLKVYNASDVNNLQLLDHVSGMDTYDVIAYNKVALVVAKDGLYQYDYTNTSSLKLLSKISINKQ
ncbi:MAG TPA: hypothetical protein VFZ42_02420 [Chitinophagaceae bacterium]